jgi:hypothetical protein
MLWRDMRGRTKEIHKKLQDLDPLCPPHLKERWIGGNIDLDLLSILPQKDARNMGGMERESKLLKVNNGGEREGVANSPRKKKGPFIVPSMKYGHCRIFRPDYPASGGKIRPSYWEQTTRNSMGGGQIIRPKFGRLIRPGRIINTKTVITFASGLCFS